MGFGRSKRRTIKLTDPSFEEFVYARGKLAWLIYTVFFSRQFQSAVKIFPGLRMPLGSKLALIRCITSISSAERVSDK
jgi:hypothetical protein